MEMPQIRFDDGAAYEDFMGRWSRLAGEVFLPWLAPAPGGRWADIGCGNGAFTTMLVERCAPAQVEALDPSEAQLAYARGRLADAPVGFHRGDAMALPWPDASFDAAVMALVIFFVPEPARGVAEMARVVRPGGTVSAYAWDIPGGGFPFQILHEVMAESGTPSVWPPSSDASRIEALEALWRGAGLVDVETRRIDLHRSFADFETFWRIARTGPSLAARLPGMPSADVAALQDRLRTRLPTDAAGRITCSAWAHAVKGRVGVR